MIYERYRITSYNVCYTKLLRYPPASTFKVIMTTALLAENAISPDKKIVCEGEIEYGDRIFRCHIRRPGHGPLDLKNALAQSCDIYYWIVGRRNNFV